MALTIQTDQTPIDAAGTFELDSGAELHYRTPTGREQSRYRQMSAAMQDERDQHIAAAPEPDDDQIERVRDARDEDLDEDEAVEMLKRATFVPSDDLRRRYLRLARDITIGCSGIAVPDGEGGESKLDWSDDDQICAVFGVEEADRGRLELMDRLGQSGSESENVLYDYIAEVFSDQTLSEEDEGNSKTT